jgi:hypothetical protein
MRPIVDPKTMSTFPIDPVADFTFEENFIERTIVFHELFTMEDDSRFIAGWIRLDWKIDNQSFN